jgi:hypothetical protein
MGDAVRAAVVACRSQLVAELEDGILDLRADLVGAGTRASGARR